MTHRDKKHGFTLIELMVVVTIIGTVTAMALPSVTNSLAQQKVRQAANDVVKLYRRARYRSMAYGRAHVVVYKGGVNDFGFEVYRGVSPDCMHNDWGALAGNFTSLDCAGRTACIDSLTDADYDSDTSDGDYILVSGWNNATTCYEAGANSRQWLNLFLWGTAWFGNTGKAGLGFTVVRIQDGDRVGVNRKVMIPWSTGSPRIIR